MFAFRSENKWCHGRGPTAISWKTMTKEQTKPLKENKCRFTKVSLIQWETGFNSLHICSFEWKSVQYKPLFPQNFSAGEKTPIYRSCLTNPSTALPSAEPWIAMPKPGGWSWARSRTQEHIQLPQPCSSPGSPSQFKMHPLHGDFAHFCRMRHQITKCSGHIMPPLHRSTKGKEQSDFKPYLVQNHNCSQSKKQVLLNHMWASL